MHDKAIDNFSILGGDDICSQSFAYVEILQPNARGSWRLFSCAETSTDFSSGPDRKRVMRSVSG